MSSVLVRKFKSFSEVIEDNFTFIVAVKFAMALNLIMILSYAILGGQAP